MVKREVPEKNRPPRLLNLQRSPASNKAITTSNQDRSHLSLLGLPAEIRARIFKYAIGGNTIHISPVQRVTRTRLCLHPTDYDDVSCKIVIDSPMDVRNDDRAPNHANCIAHHSQTGANISLGLLGTSRQIYHETCLLPFSHNRFVFDSRDTMEHDNILTNLFKRYINNTQVRTIAEAIFDGHYIRHFGSGEPIALALMTGLKKKVTIFYLASQCEFVVRSWYATAGVLAEDKELTTFLGSAIGRAHADHTYAIDFKTVIEMWQAQQEFKQSDVYKNPMLAIQQRASASGQ